MKLSKLVHVIPVSNNIVALYHSINIKTVFVSSKFLGHLDVLDKNNASAHRSLGRLQAVKGDLKSAEQSYLKFLALERTNINAYLELAEVYLQLEEAPKAFALADQASGLEPANPKVLDFLIEVSIITRDRQAALKAWRLLHEVNPENQKLDEFKERIDKL